MSAGSIDVARTKLAELASTMGALLIGFGVGAWLAHGAGAWTLGVGAFGVLLHSIGMFYKHAQERTRSPQRILWIESLYWSCWIVLALGAAWLALFGAR